MFLGVFCENYAWFLSSFSIVLSVAQDIIHGCSEHRTCVAVATHQRVCLMRIHYIHYIPAYKNEPPQPNTNRVTTKKKQEFDQACTSEGQDLDTHSVSTLRKLEDQQHD